MGRKIATAAAVVVAVLLTSNLSWAQAPGEVAQTIYIENMQLWAGEGTISEHVDQIALQVPDLSSLSDPTTKTIRVGPFVVEVKVSTGEQPGTFSISAGDDVKISPNTSALAATSAGRIFIPPDYVSVQFAGLGNVNALGSASGCFEISW